MNKQSRAGAGSVLALCLCFGFGPFGYAQASSAVRSAVQKEAVVTAHASGTFEVKVTPQAPDDKTEDANLGRMTIEKQFHGDLEGTCGHCSFPFALPDCDGVPWRLFEDPTP